ncbi:MAG: type IV pilus secretin PilQ [Rhodoferax sp.]
MNIFNRHTLRQGLRRLGCALLACLGLGLAHAEQAIQAVSGSVQGGAEVLRIDLSEPLSTPPKGFTIQSPARIALDFPGASSALGRTNVDINQGNLRSVSVVQAGDRTRVVLNLKQATPYTPQLQGKTLYIVLAAATETTPAPAPANTAAAAPARGAQALKDLDFRRGEEGAGRVVVSLPNSQVGVDLRQQGQTLVAEFMQTTLPEGLRRKLDVADFATPVKTVTTTELADRVRVVIEPQGQWTHSAYQSDSQFVIEVKPLKIDPTKLTQGPGYNGEKLSLNFQSIDVRSLLQVIADFTSFNIVTSDSVTGTVTLRLQDVPWDQALDIILQSKGLDKRKTGNVIWIAPKDEILAKEKQELEAAAALQGLEPLRTQSFQLNYTKAADVAAQLTASTSGGGGAAGGGGAGSTAGTASGARMLSPRGSVIAEPRTNQLFVTDIAARLEQVQQLISKIDVPARQVLIEARIVEAADTFGKSLGVKLGGSDLRAQQGGDGGYSIGNGNRVAVGTSYTNAVASSGADGAVNVGGQFVNLPALAPSGALSIPTFALSLFSATANRFLNLEISALEADSKGKVVASPRVVTADQKPALIEQGIEFPYQVATSSGATSIAFRKASLKLEVTPQITPDGSVLLDIDVTKDTKGDITPAGYAINTKHVRTQVQVENGGTVVIGGIFTEEQKDAVDKVPFFGDLPAVGNLFKRKFNSIDKQEMLVFITPKVVTEKSAR